MGNKSSVFLWEFSCFVVPVIEVFANPFYGPGRLYGTGYDDRFERRRRKKQPAFPSALKNKEHASHIRYKNSVAKRLWHWKEITQPLEHREL